MGLVAADLYTHNLINQFSGKFLEALEEAAKRVDDGSADAACTRWFGDNSGPFKKDLAKTLRKMRSVVNVKTIRVSFQALATRNTDENAAAWNDRNRHLNLGDNFAHVGAHGGITSEVYLNEAFSGLPSYLVKKADNTVDDSFWNQSKFNTIVHEVSHLILGTADETYHGRTAYGAERAAQLARRRVSRAKNNAENWGIFIEAVGLNKSS